MIMGKIFREIVKNEGGSWCDPRIILTNPTEEQVKIEQVIAVNISSPTKKIRIGVKTSDADIDNNPIKDWENVEKDTPVMITVPIYLMKGDRVYAIFSGAKKFSDLRLQVHGEYVDLCSPECLDFIYFR